MTDRGLAKLALVVALVALVLIIVHALIRDAESGGPAHTMGFGTVGGSEVFPFSTLRWRWGEQRTPAQRETEAPTAPPSGAGGIIPLILPERPTDGVRPALPSSVGVSPGTLINIVG